MLLLCRCTHNELEKNRRAHQRSLLGELQKRVDPGDDGVRATTLNILKRAYQEISVRIKTQCPLNHLNLVINCYSKSFKMLFHNVVF